MKSKSEIAKRFKRHLQETQRGLSSQYQNTRDCQGFYAGDMMAYRDSIQFQDAYGQKKKAMVSFNKCKPYVNAVKGFMAQNRREANYSACMDNNPMQDMYSKYANALKKYVREKANADQKETQQNGDMLINGYGVIETAMTYDIGQATTDPNGQIIMGRLDPLKYGWDPFARAPNLMDRRWDFYQEDYALEDALNLFDDSDEDDFELATDHDVGEDSGYKWFARGGRYNKIKDVNIDWADREKDMVKVYFYQWYEFETFYQAENPIFSLQNPLAVSRVAMELEMLAQEVTDEDRDLFSFNPKDEILTFNGEMKKKLVESLGEFIEPVPRKRKVFYSAVISKDHVFTAYQNPCQQGFTRKVKTGDYDAINKIWTGMINSMKEPVMYYNKALTELMFIIGANSKGGVLVERGAVEDIQKFEAKYAKTDAVIVVEDGALSGGKIQPKGKSQQVTGYENIIQLCDASVNDVNGIDKSFLGSSDSKQETGLLQSRRIRQVVSSLACYFDSDTLYLKEHAELLMDYMRIYAENNVGGLFRLIGKDGRDMFMKISADKLVPVYDIAINEAPQSPEEKQEWAGIISSAADKLLQVDPASAKRLYAIALKYLPLERIDQQEILQILSPQQPQIDPAYVQKLEQGLKALMSDMSQADLKKKLSEYALNMAKVGEVNAKVGEIGSSAIKNKAAAFHDVHEALLDESVARHEAQHPQQPTTH